MLKGNLKFTAAEQRTVGRTRAAWRAAWIWLPVTVLTQLGLIYLTVLLFLVHSPRAWILLPVAVISLLAGIRAAKDYL